MKKQYQVTLICESGKYRPVSCLIQRETADLNNRAEKVALVQKGMEKICAKRYWRSADLKKYGYTRAKVREYDKDLIEKENRAKYEAIKEAHYAEGSWKRPKEKE